jgi:hypothetical protein
MSEQDERTTKRARHAWSLADKIWLLDYRVANKTLSAVQLAEALAKHANFGRATDQVEVLVPGKSAVNDWLRQEVKLREKHDKAASSSQQRARAPNHPQLEEALMLWFRQSGQHQCSINVARLHPRMSLLTTRLLSATASFVLKLVGMHLV